MDSSSSSSGFDRREEDIEQDSFSGNKSSAGFKDPIDANRMSGDSAVAHVTSGQALVIDVPVMPAASPPSSASHHQQQEPQPSPQADKSPSPSSSSASSSSSSSSCPSTVGPDVSRHHNVQTPPPVAPPRHHRSHNSVSRGSGVKVLDPESRLGNKVTLSPSHQHEDTTTSTMTGSSGGGGVVPVSNNNSNAGKQSVKQGLRQRHPALLLQPLHATPTSKSLGSQQSQSPVTPSTPSSTSSPSMHPIHGYPSIGNSAHLLQSQAPHSLKPNPVSSLMPSTFWTGNRYPSESEFDTTRLEAYISSFTSRAALLSSTQQQQLQQLQQQQQQQFLSHRGLRRGSKSHHNNMSNNRSKSVDRSLKLMSAMSLPPNQRQLHIMMPSSSAPGARYHHHSNHHPSHPYYDLHHPQHGMSQYHVYPEQRQQHNSLSKIMTSLRNVSLHSSGRHGGQENRALVVSRSESLNSSDPESGSTSGDNETETPSHKSAISFMDPPPKSALKKSSSNSFPVSSSSSASKNVTFSAFATVQMVDR